MCPFPIYPLYTRTVILSLDKPIADCFLFRPRKRLEKRRKRSHTNVSSTLSTRTSTPPAQTAHVRFHEQKCVHTRLSAKDRTQRLTRRNTGVSDGGGYHYPRSVPHVSETLRGRILRTANFAAFGSWPGVLPKNTESLRDSDALMRVAVTRRRGPAGLRDPVAVSLAALMGFAVLVAHDNSTPRKILAGFTRRSAPCVLPRAAVPLPCPQHPSAADKTGRWKTGSAGSCRADFRFACARPA